jgi:hypothetical protein
MPVNEIVYYAVAFYMVAPDLIGFLEKVWILIKTGKWANVWNWYNYIHKDSKFFRNFFYPHVKLDTYTHSNMGGIDWFPKFDLKNFKVIWGRFHWELYGWMYSLLILQYVEYVN